VFLTNGNIYESYNMSGQRGGDTGGNYLEHCGGFAWVVTEGAFGIDFESDCKSVHKRPASSLWSLDFL